MNYQSNSPQYKHYFQGAPAYPAARNNKFYPAFLVSVFGSLCLIGCAFLPWMSFKALDLQLSIDGLGNISGSSPLSGPTGYTGDGVLAIGLGVILLVLSALGSFLGKNGFAIAAMVFGLIATGLMILKLSDISSAAKILEGNTGLGVYLGLAGALVALVGGSLPLVLKRS